MFREPSRMPERGPLIAFTVLLGAAIVSAASARAADAAGASQPSPAAATVEADPYLVVIRSTGPYQVGATGSVTVSLTAKAGFHINDQYPYRFTTSPPVAGVSYPKPVLERADGKFEEKSAVFDVPFIAARAGEYTVGGVLNLSVCNASSCIVHKAPLDVTVRVR